MKRILVDYGRFRRTALIHDGELIELAAEDAACAEAPTPGNIYAGLVKNVLPSNFVFIDIGCGKQAFLDLNDGRERGLLDGAPIKPGREILVQVLKEPAGEKGASVTSQLSVSDRDLVIFAEAARGSNSGRVGDADGDEEAFGRIGVSKKITSTAERRRLTEIVDGLLPEGCGAIVRTSAAGKTAEVLGEKITTLLKLSREIRERGAFAKAPSLVYGRDGVLTSLMSEDVDSVIINASGELENVRRSVEAVVPGSGVRVTLHEGNTPLFDEFFLENNVRKALEKRVWLNCGGFITIERTEACYVIDVNTGKFAGGSGHGATIFKTNMEAAKEIARQLRLRNLSGIIIIDFINMKKESEREGLYSYVKKLVKGDRLSVSVITMTPTGLMQLTRKKEREPLAAVLLRDCPTCGGTGAVARTGAQ